MIRFVLVKDHFACGEGEGRTEGCYGDPMTDESGLNCRSCDGAQRCVYKGKSPKWSDVG